MCDTENTVLPTDHFSQNPLFIGRFHHLAFENHFAESEMLMVKEGEKACDINLAETQVRKSHCSWFITVSREVIFIGGFQQNGCLHKPEKERKQQKMKQRSQRENATSTAKGRNPWGILNPLCTVGSEA